MLVEPESVIAVLGVGPPTTTRRNAEDAIEAISVGPAAVGGTSPDSVKDSYFAKGARKRDIAWARRSAAASSKRAAENAGNKPSRKRMPQQRSCK